MPEADIAGGLAQPILHPYSLGAPSKLCLGGGFLPDLLERPS